jgi:hypothetical protein
MFRPEQNAIDPSVAGNRPTCDQSYNRLDT